MTMAVHRQRIRDKLEREDAARRARVMERMARGAGGAYDITRQKGANFRRRLVTTASHGENYADLVCKDRNCGWNSRTGTILTPVEGDTGPWQCGVLKGAGAINILRTHRRERNCNSGGKFIDMTMAVHRQRIRDKLE